MFIIDIHRFSKYLIYYICMRKIYFFESVPEPKVWEKMVQTINGKAVSQTCWVISKKLNGDSQKITYKNKNEILKMPEQEIKRFEPLRVLN